MILSLDFATWSMIFFSGQIENSENGSAVPNLGRFGPGSFRPGSFRPGSFQPIFRVGRFGLSRWVVSAHFRGESFWPWVVSAKVFRNY